MTFMLASAELLILIVLAIQAFAIVDIVRRSEGEWQQIEQSRIAWLLVALLVPFLGAVMYLMYARPKFKKAKRISTAVA